MPRIHPARSPLTLPGQRCCSLDGELLEEEMMHGVRTWGNDPDSSTAMLVGAYESMGDLSERLLRALLEWRGIRCARKMSAILLSSRVFRVDCRAVANNNQARLYPQVAEFLIHASN